MWDLSRDEMTGNPDRSIRLGCWRYRFPRSGLVQWRLCRHRHKRHAFAVTVLLRWYRAGMDVQVKLPLLAAYMGHVSIVSTAYYLQFVEPLAAAASARFADHCGALITSTPVRGGAR